MSKDFVHIREVGIHRVPGIRRGDGFKLRDLSKGINIIFGPNGAGKSTTCRVIQELLWPGQLSRPSVEGVIADADGEWHIDIDAGRVQSLRDGSPGVSEFGSSDVRGRYHLGLKEFIVEDNADFARKIAEASQGGYDLEAAAGSLGYSRRPTGPKSLRDRLQQRERAVQDARAAQREIEGEANKLRVLRRELAEAAEAEARLERFRKVEAYHAAVQRCREIEAEKDAFAEGVGRLRGDEKETLEAFAAKEQALSTRLTTEKERLRQAQNVLEELKLPEDGIPENVVSDLRVHKHKLNDLEVRINEQRSLLTKARTKAETARSVLGATFAENQLDAMTALALPDLSTFARKADHVRARRAVLAERRRWLESDEPDEARSVEERDLQNGIHALARWLAEAGQAGADAASSAALAAAAMLLVALTVALLVLQHWVWFVVAAIGALLLGYELWARRYKPSSTSGRDAHRKAYAGLSLREPEAWDAGGISEQLRVLTRLSGQKALAAERRSRLRALEIEEREIEQKEEELDERRTELAELLACTIEVEDEWLPVLVDRISSWQRASTALIAATEALRDLERERSELLDAMAGTVSAFTQRRIDSTAAAEECLADLERLRRGHVEARKAATEARHLIDASIQPDLDELSSARSAFFERLEIGPDETALIADWLERRQDFLDCTERLVQATTLRNDKRSALDGYEDLLELDDDELHRRVQEVEAIAPRRDELSKDIGGIERSIRDAKAGHVLSDALAQRDDAREALAAAREENGRLRAGAALTDWVRQVAVDGSRPQVFQRANELFVRFTRGTLHLQMDDRSSTPAFLARRGTEAPQALNELSDGERVQLMTAVRLAFIELDETKALPLLADEVLGMSDDGRSEVMIDTIIDVALQGRQVFYCTAQHDEVGKWIARLDGLGIDYKLFDLAEIRRLATARTNPLKIVAIPRSSPPSPRGLDYEAYGRELRVPGIDPGLETIDMVHLWHLFDEASALHELLRRDVMTWGQLQTLLEHGGAGLIDAADDETFAGARAAAMAIEAACEAWRIGRGKPVDRSALMDSGCVTDNFIDRVTDLAARVGGDAHEFVKGLERGEVGRFWASKIEDLRDYFETEGYLPLETALEPEDVRVRVMAVTAQAIRTGMLNEAHVERIIAEIVAPPAGRRSAA
jgi:uncharacterized protein YhaN